MTSCQTEVDIKYMQLALAEAHKADSTDEVPVGAIIVNSVGKILSKSGNLRETLKSTIAHAEMITLHRACKKLDSWRLTGCTLYVTLEPCFMCAGALVQSRLSRVVFGAADPKGGALCSLAELGSDSRLNHQFAVTGGILATDCSKILKDFFKKKRG